MATNPVIVLNGARPLDLGNELLRIDQAAGIRENTRAQRQQTDELKETGAVRKRLLDQRERRGQQEISAADRAVVDEERARQMAALSLGFEHAENLLTLPFERREAAHLAFEDSMRSLGFEIDDVPDDLSDEGLQSLMAELEPFRDTGGTSPRQFQAQGRVKDSEGNVFASTEIRDPSTGEVETRFTNIDPTGPSQPVGAVEFLNPSTNLTSTEQQARDVETVRLAAAAEESIRRGAEFADQARSMRSNISTLREISGLLSGAKGEIPRTGPIWDKLPDITASASRLNQLKNQAGLGIIQNTTFGALSEGELKLALDTALPTNLEATELRKWVNDRIRAQEKMANELEKAGIYYSQGGTVDGYLEKLRVERNQRLSEENDGAEVQTFDDGTEVVFKQ